MDWQYGKNFFCVKNFSWPQICLYRDIIEKWTVYTSHVVHHGQLAYTCRQISQSHGKTPTVLHVLVYTLTSSTKLFLLSLTYYWHDRHNISRDHNGLTYKVTPVHLQSYPNTFAPTPSGSCTCSSPLHTCLCKPSPRWCQATLAQNLSIVLPRLPPLQWREMHQMFHDIVGGFSNCLCSTQLLCSPAVAAESWLDNTLRFDDEEDTTPTPLRTDIESFFRLYCSRGRRRRCDNWRECTCSPACPSMGGLPVGQSFELDQLPELPENWPSSLSKMCRYNMLDQMVNSQQM